MKKPHPREYGFENEFEVRTVLSEEDRRQSRIRNAAGIITFIAVFVLTAVWFIHVSKTAVPSIIVTGKIIGVAIMGAIPAFILAAAARVLTETLHQPSDKYLKARQYSIANRMWIQRLQREYGYES